MTDRIFIERAFTIGKITPDPNATATVSGEWYFWFPPIYHSKQIDEIVGYFNMATKVSIEDNTRTLFWKNYSLMLDLFVSTICPGFHGVTETMFSLSVINGAHAHVQLVHHSSGFIAARVQHLAGESARRLAAMDISAELMHLGQLFSTRTRRPSPNITPIDVNDLVEKNITDIVIKPAPEIKVANSQLVLAGYFYKTTRFFADPEMHSEYSDSSPSVLLTRTYYSSRTYFQKYSLVKRILMFLTRKSFDYYDENTQKSLV